MAKYNTVDIDLSLENTALAPLHTARSDKRYMPVPNKSLPKSLLGSLQILYKAITGNELDADEATILLAFQDGTPDAIWGPSVYWSTDWSMMVIRWGRDFLPLKLEDGGIVSEGSEVAFSVQEVKVGKWNEDCLVAKFRDGSNIYKLPLRLNHADFRNKESLESLTLMFEDGDTDGLSTAIRNIDPSASTGGSGGGGTTFALDDAEIGVYSIEHIKPIDVSWGQTNILTLKHIESGESNQFWSNKTINMLLKAGMVVDGATITMPGVDVACEFESEIETIDMSFLG